jgi:hypothetical protein
MKIEATDSRANNTLWHFPISWNCFKTGGKIISKGDKNSDGQTFYSVFVHKVLTLASMMDTIWNIQATFNLYMKFKLYAHYQITYTDTAKRGVGIIGLTTDLTRM